MTLVELTVRGKGSLKVILWVFMTFGCSIGTHSTVMSLLRVRPRFSVGVRFTASVGIEGAVS